VVLEHRGDLNSIEDSVRKFIEWRKQNHLPPKIISTFNILYNDPSEPLPENFRLDICASTEQDVTDRSFGVVEKTIPSSRCAVLQQIGDDANLADSFCLNRPKSTIQFRSNMTISANSQKDISAKIFLKTHL
jgi:AraC family transcriptional regulator